MLEKCPECGYRIRKGESICRICGAKYTPDDIVLVSRTQETDNQYLEEEHLIDIIAVELKKDIDYLLSLGIKLEKGTLATKTGGTALAGYKVFKGDLLSALVIGGISLLVCGLTNGYKRIKLMELKQKWWDKFSGLNQEQLDYLAAGLQRKYPLLLGQFQNLLQAGQG